MPVSTGSAPLAFLATVAKSPPAAISLAAFFAVASSGSVKVRNWRLPKAA
jgi:hypothetical protein